MADSSDGTLRIAVYAGFDIDLNSAAECGIVKVWYVITRDCSRSGGRKLCRAMVSTPSHEAKSVGSLRELAKPTYRVG